MNLTWVEVGCKVLFSNLACYCLWHELSECSNTVGFTSLSWFLCRYCTYQSIMHEEEDCFRFGDFRGDLIRVFKRHFSGYNDCSYDGLSVSATTSLWFSRIWRLHSLACTKTLRCMCCRGVAATPHHNAGLLLPPAQHIQAPFLR